MKKLISINFFIILFSGIAAQSVEELNKEVAIKYLNAYMEADLNTLALVLDKTYRHYLFDMPKEDYEGLINLVKKKGKGGDTSILEIVAIKDNVFVRWTSQYHLDTYNGANWITIKNGKIIVDREYYKKTN